MTYTHHIPTCKQSFQWAPPPRAPLGFLEGSPRTKRRKVEMTPLEKKKEGVKCIRENCLRFHQQCPLNGHWHQCLSTLCFPSTSRLSGTISWYNFKLNPVTVHHPTGRESSRVMGDTCFSKEPTFQSTQNVNKSKMNPGLTPRLLFIHQCVCVCKCMCKCVSVPMCEGLCYIR